MMNEQIDLKVLSITDLYTYKTILLESMNNSDYCISQRSIIDIERKYGYVMAEILNRLNNL